MTICVGSSIVSGLAEVLVDEIRRYGIESWTDCLLQLDT